MSFRSFVWLGTLMLCLSLASLEAQVVTGTISGRVTDSTGALIPGATVQVQNTETGLSRNVQTDAGGRYEARNLPAGSYSITVQQPGFRTEVRSGITLTIASEIVVNLGLSVGEVQEKVEVTGEAPVIETTNATLSGLVSQEQMRDLPLNGRSFEQLALLSPGVAVQPDVIRNGANGVGVKLSVNGQRYTSNLFLLDGTTVNDHSGKGSSSAAGLSLGVEAIREFRVLTHNFSAEYGRNSGAVVSAITRSGTNEFHGSAYEFLRNNIFDARNFFNPGDLPAYRQNQFGASFGGRLVKDRVFFFVNYEGLRIRKGVTTISNVPDANAHKGLLPNAAGVPQPVPFFNPLIVPYLEIYPLPSPNGRNFGNGVGEFINNFSQPTTEDYAMERMDFRLSDKDSFYWRYVFNPSDILTPGYEPPFVNPETGINHFVVLSETHVFSGGMLNEFRFGFNRSSPTTDTAPLVIQNGKLDFIPGEGFGNFAFAGVGTVPGQLEKMGNMSARPKAWAQNLFQETDTFSYVKGPHSWKFGVDVERLQTNNSVLSRRRGEYTFASISTLLAGVPSDARFALASVSSSGSGWRQTMVGWFVQDDYRVRPNLTLNLGFRHEFVTTPNEVNGKSGNLRNVTDTASIVGPPYLTSKRNFAPRVGMAWDVFGNGKTSVRLGTGIFYNHLLGDTGKPDDYHFVKSYRVKNPPNFPNLLLSGFTPGINTVSTTQFNADTPTVVHFNLEIQQQLSSTVSVRAGYVGSHGYNIEKSMEQDITVADIVSRFPGYSKSWSPGAPLVNPSFSSISQLLTNSVANYHALQLGLNKSFSSGLLMQANYTWGKSLSDADGGQIQSSPSAVLDIHDFGRDYGRSVYDQRHTFSFNSRYKLPLDNLLQSRLAKAAIGGWSVSGVLQAGSGFPLDIVDGFNNSLNGDSSIPDCPNAVPGFNHDPNHGTTKGCNFGTPSEVKAGQKLGTADLFYDPCAFELSPLGTFGNLGRNTLTGPKLFTVNFTMAKTFAVTERANLEFRAEFFNIFNHANFRAPLNQVFVAERVRAGNSGRITETSTDNRDIQFALKLTF